VWNCDATVRTWSGSPWRTRVIIDERGSVFGVNLPDKSVSRRRWRPRDKRTMSTNRKNRKRERERTLRFINCVHTIYSLCYIRKYIILRILVEYIMRRMLSKSILTFFLAFKQYTRCSIPPWESLWIKYIFLYYTRDREHLAVH